MSMESLLERFAQASEGFAGVLAAVRLEQWVWPTPCSEWTVRDVVNHMARGNLNYVRLLEGADRAAFLRWRDADALGADPVGGYARSVRECAAAFARPDAAERVLDYPLGAVTGRQALAVRTADSIVHTWDLACAVGADRRLDPDLVGWLDDHLTEIYAGLAETPLDPDSSHRFFAVPGSAPAGASRQDRLLRLLGRDPSHLTNRS